MGCAHPAAHSSLGSSFIPAVPEDREGQGEEKSNLLVTEWCARQEMSLIHWERLIRLLESQTAAPHLIKEFGEQGIKRELKIF